MDLYIHRNFKRPAMHAAAYQQGTGFFLVELGSWTLEIDTTAPFNSGVRKFAKACPKTAFMYLALTVCVVFTEPPDLTPVKQVLAKINQTLT